jgi:hypothetical protein
MTLVPTETTETRRIVHRLRATSVSTTNTGQYPACLGNLAQEQESVALVPLVDSVTRGDSEPGWRQLLRTGQGATTRLIGVKWSATYTTASYTQTGKKGGIAQCVRRSASGHNVNALSGVSPPSTSISSEADAKARSAYLNSYTNAVAKFRGANVLAEFAETVNMFKRAGLHLFSNTTDFAKDVRKIKKIARESERYAERLADLWLSYVFGAKPLVSDIQDAHRAFQNMARLGLCDTQRIAGTGRSDRVMESETLRQGSPQFFAAEHDYRIFREESVRYLGGVVVPVPGSDALLNWGLGVQHLAPAVWEGIPWSFLVDYFTNIGEIVEATQYAFGSLRWQQRTYRNVRTKVVTAMRPPANMGGDNANYDFAVSGGAAKVEVVYVNRQPQTAFPVPGFQFKIPGLDSLKWVNIAALLATIRNGKP